MYNAKFFQAPATDDAYRIKDMLPIPSLNRASGHPSTPTRSLSDPDVEANFIFTAFVYDDKKKWFIRQTSIWASSIFLLFVHHPCTAKTWRLAGSALHRQLRELFCLRAPPPPALGREP